MAGLTLLESAKLHGGDEYAQAITELYAETSDILRVLPFRTIQGNAYHYNVETTLPGIAFRGVNGSWTAGAGIVNPETEHLTISGGEVDVDRFLVKTQGPHTRGTHVNMKVKHLAHNWVYKFIKGSSATTPAEFDGLQTRLTGDQKISMGNTSGGVVLSLAKLDQLIDSVAEPTHLIMSRAMRRLLTAAARLTTVGGDIRWEINQFGRRIAMYGDLPILIADSLTDYYDTLGFDEADEGAGGTACTSIYCVSFRDGMLEGIHNAPPSVEDLGEISSSPVYRTRVEWYSGLLLQHPKAAARLWSIKTGAVTV